MVKDKTSHDSYTDAQLKTVLRNAGHRVGNMRRETMLKRIAEIEAAKAEAGPVMRGEQIEPIPSPVYEEPLPPAKPIAIGGCSQAQVMEAIKDNVAKGMTAMFHDNCWTFRHGKREDSGTLAQAVGNIVKCADAVMRQAVSADRLGLTKSLLF